MALSHHRPHRWISSNIGGRQAISATDPTRASLRWRGYRRTPPLFDIRPVGTSLGRLSKLKGNRACRVTGRLGDPRRQSGARGRWHTGRRQGSVGFTRPAVRGREPHYLQGSGRIIRKLTEPTIWQVFEHRPSHRGSPLRRCGWHSSAVHQLRFVGRFPVGGEHYFPTRLERDPNQAALVYPRHCPGADQIGGGCLTDRRWTSPQRPR